MEKKISFPLKLIKPISVFLEKEIVRLKRQEKKIRKSDPFKNIDRLQENSVEDDLDEQIGHFDVQVKTNFIKKQIVQLRKVLTRIKIGKYGICESCSKMIDTDRLSIKPDSTVCIDCEREREK